MAKPLAGKPEPGDFFWSGVATDFSKEPFELTMDVHPAKLENLTISPCQLSTKTKR